MEEEKFVKPVKKYGNSGGVYVPSSWIGGNVEVRLVSRPPEPEKDILNAFSEQMPHIIGAFVYGSYARGEHEEDSDIDVMIITDDCTKNVHIPGSLKIRNYDINVASKSDAVRAARNDVIFKMMVNESKPIFNHDILNELMSIKTGTRTMETRIDMAKSSLGIIKGLVDLGGEPFAEIVYPLVMRIKEMLMIKCYLKGKRYSRGLLEDHIMSRGIQKADFDLIMGIYRALRDEKKKPKTKPNPDDIPKLVSMLDELISDVEKEKIKKRN